MKEEEIVLQIQKGNRDLESVLLQKFGYNGFVGNSAGEGGQINTGYKISYSGLIRKTAARYQSMVNRTTGVDFEDVLQACAIGVIKAAEKYDPDEGMSFKSFAIWSMRNEARNLLGIRSDHIRVDTTNRSIVVTRDFLEDAKIYGSKEYIALEKVLIKHPGFKLTTGKVSSKIETLGIIDSLDAPTDGDEGLVIGEVFSDDRIESCFQDPEKHLVNDEMRNIVRAAVRQLPEDERRSIEDSVPGPVRMRAYRKLRNNRKLRKLWEDYYDTAAYSSHVGLAAYANTGISEVEKAVFHRERVRRQMESVIADGVLREARKSV